MATFKFPFHAFYWIFRVNCLFQDAIIRIFRARRLGVVLMCNNIGAASINPYLLTELQGGNSSFFKNFKKALVFVNARVLAEGCVVQIFSNYLLTIIVVLFSGAVGQV